MKYRVQVTENFYLDEFIHPVIYAARGAKSIQLIDHRMILLAQFIRDNMGPIFINTWATGGDRKNSGLRYWKEPLGATWSQHYFGNAFDCVSPQYKPKDIHEFLLANQDQLIERGWLTTLEALKDTPTWTHVDNRYTGLSKIQIVNK